MPRKSVFLDRWWENEWMNFWSVGKRSGCWLDDDLTLRAIFLSFLLDLWIFSWTEQCSQHHLWCHMCPHMCVCVCVRGFGEAALPPGCRFLWNRKAAGGQVRWSNMSFHQTEYFILDEKFFNECSNSNSSQGKCGDTCGCKISHLTYLLKILLLPHYIHI